MYRFVLSPRWMGFALFVVVLSGVCIRLGMWQFDRLDQRLADSEVIEKHLDADPQPLEEVLADDSSVADDDEWRPVVVTGTYDTEHEVVVKYQTGDDGPGVDVVTPLVTADGRAVLVDRGWMSAPNNTASIDDIPAPPSGEVTVTAWLRPDSGAETSAVEPDDQQVRAISSEGIATSVPYDLYPGYVNLRSEDPESADPLVPEDEPELGQGPHFFYGLQWMFFAALAIFGWFYFAWTEAHPRKPRGHGARGSSAPAAESPAEDTVERRADGEYSIRG